MSKVMIWLGWLSILYLSTKFYKELFLNHFQKLLGHLWLIYIISGYMQIITNILPPSPSPFNVVYTQ